ncbi:MAG: GGDEF domain-containing protein [Alkaliphilus sp.]|nr:GGDEF domain-containing protein [Alkaliphilus sp.]
MNKKSSTILIILGILLFFLIGTISSILRTINITEKDAMTINNVGSIRGSSQRLVKLELSQTRSSDLIEEIDEKIMNFEVIAKNPKSPNVELSEAYDYLLSTWADLKAAIYAFRQNPSEENRQTMIEISEKIWNHANATVLETQLYSEYKFDNFRKVLPFLAIDFILIILLILMIKRFVRDELEIAVNYDPLTKIHNRNFYYESLKRETIRAQRYGKPFVLIIFDIDHFKNVNDTYGHDVGDIVLKELSRLCGYNVRKSDILARIGGEEFSVLAPETDITSGIVLAEKFLNIVNSHEFEKVKHITISIGVAQYVAGDSLDDVFKRADIALYKAKNNGRNRVEVEV